MNAQCRTQQLFAVRRRADPVSSAGDGRPSVVNIDLHQLRSDQRLRDRYVRGSMFPDHPTAVFTLQELGILPGGLADGKEVEAQITGVLNIQGADFSLMFDVTTQDRGRLRCPSP